MSAATALERAAAVRLMAFDVDGTLTDGGLQIGPSGEAFKRFSVRDGMGLVLLREAGIRVALVTGRSSAIVEQRARELRIDTVLQGVGDKAAAMRELCAQAGIAPAQAGFMGDDWPDLPAMMAVGFAAAVPDAAPEVRRVAHWTATAPAGGGAARELAEHLLRTQGRLDAMLGRFDGRVA
ncbi:MAG: HAD-IIIA family hydrolase [Burkholderiales bacterium]|nr:MAG: HAD-IIIA family hydrolase [Burkholderiales bacterium]